MNYKNILLGTTILILTVSLIQRFVRPMNIFVVSEAFEKPIRIDKIPGLLSSLSARECEPCHLEFYKEWSTTIHSQAWTDPYFQVDFRFDGSQQICKNCHIPLENQQEYLVLGFRDKEKWDPILKPNPGFDAKLQKEGVTCAVCHIKNGKILGPYGRDGSPHPVKKMENGNRICLRCHVVEGDRWDTFYRLPPCGTVAEIRTGHKNQSIFSFPLRRTREIAIPDMESLHCIECHMPLMERPIVEGGEVRPVRRHLWRGGHDNNMVKSGIKAELREEASPSTGRRTYALTLTNTGASHYFPTGTPDRHLTVSLRLLDSRARIIREKSYKLKRTILWWPLIIDLWDTRLPSLESRTYRITFSSERNPEPARVEAVMRYHLLDERRRRRIGYENKAPISFEVLRRRISVKR